MDAYTYQMAIEFQGMPAEILEEALETYAEQRDAIQRILYSGDMFMEEHLDACLEHLKHLIAAIQEEILNRASADEDEDA